MTDFLRAAADLADKLGPIDLDEILPTTEPVIDCDDLAVHKVELRQIAGISAGGRLELTPGCEYDFGPVRRGHGRLDDGQPDSVGFTLRLDDQLSVTVGPGTGPVLIDAEPVTGPTDVGDRVINAGSARFVVARPRPPRKRSGRRREDTERLDPWVLAPVPGPLGRAGGHPDRAAELVDQRRRLHAGPDEVSHRIEGGGPLLWDREPGHPLFGTAVVAMTDVAVRDRGLAIRTPVPVSIDLLGSPTMLVGDRSLQLAVARHLILSLAATIGPDELSLEVRSGAEDLRFVDRLPHTGAAGTHRLVIVDRPAGHDRRVPPGLHDGDTSFLVLTGANDALPTNADVVSVIDEATVNLIGAEGTGHVEGATPVGYAPSMAAELVRSLAVR